MELVLVHITAASAEEAGRIAHDLVDRRLAACANIVPGVRSIYRWKGRIEQSPEVLLLAKTRADLLPAVTDRVRALHSYECPCVAAVPIVAGYPAFLGWVEKETLGGGA